MRIGSTILAALPMVVSLTASGCQLTPTNGQDPGEAEVSRRQLITEGHLCGGCDPDCLVYTDRPEAYELNEDNAENLRVDLDRDGLVLSDGHLGSYDRNYDAWMSCSGQKLPLWSQLYWDVEVPEGATISIYGRTADWERELWDAEEVLLAQIPDDDPPSDVMGQLAAAGISNMHRFLSVRVELSAELDESPVFRRMSMVLYCVCDCDVDSDCSPGCLCDSDC
jgi:hypothetical protein